MRISLFFLTGFLLVASVAHADDVKIGVAGPMTGGLAAFGEQIQHGAQIAIDEINAQGGLLGQKLTLVSEDDACDPKQAHNVASKMVAEKVAVVFGHWCSMPSTAASSVYGEEGVLQIDVGGLLQKFTHQGFPTLFRVSTNSKNYAEIMGRTIVEHQPGATVAILNDQPAITREAAQALKDYLATTKNKVVSTEEIHGGDKDFSSVIDKVKATKPQVVVFFGYTIEAGLLARQMNEKGLDVYYYGWDTLNSPDFLSIIAGKNTGKIISVDYARPSDSPALKKITAQLEQHRWPAETTTFMTYAAFQVYADAVRAANSFEPAKVAAALHTLSSQTIVGQVQFDSFGDRKNPAFATYQWVNGQLKMTGTLPN